MKGWLMRGLEGGKRLLEPGLDNLKALVRWRGDDVEAGECEQTGVGLIFWAAVSNNARAVRELGADAIITSFRTTEAVGGAMTMHRPDLFSCFYKGSTALHVGMLFSDWELVEELLDLGISPYSKSILGIDALMSAACTPNFEIAGRAGDATKFSKITKFCARFPDWDMERKAARAGGSTALGFAVLLGPDKQDSVKALLAAGADPLYVIDTGATILHQTAANIDAGASLIELIVGIRGVRKSMIDKPIRAQTLKWKVTYFITWLAVKCGSKSALLNTVSSWPGMRPIGSAALNLNFTVIRGLRIAMANAEVTNSRGQSPLDLATIAAGGTLPPAIEMILDPHKRFRM